MTDIRKYILPLSCLALSLFSCEPKDNLKLINEDISEVRSRFAPDKRVAIFNIESVNDNGMLILKGESDKPEAIKALQEKLDGQHIQFTDSIERLPSQSLNDSIYGIINISVGNIRSQPGHSAELATQATLGTPVKVLKRSGGWFLIQTPDQYIAWIDGGGLQLLNSEQYENYKNTEKLIYLNNSGWAYASPEADAPVISDLVAGALLPIKGEVNGYFEFEYPDGRNGYIPTNTAERYKSWQEKPTLTAAELISTAKSLMGLPYLWGGTSPKGVDCSGYTKTIYYLNGIVLPRDASQQVASGELIDSSGDFSKLEPGDLLFFGRKNDDGSERVIHVGMWIGNNEFIHSSGMVRISSMDPDAPNYDSYNRKRYLRSKRILETGGKGVIDLSQEDIF
ncbi:C40 family peptidase [Robertkochia solimangrovi]|uniref:C40 family peptidase n=1 Tax=Robertkochia solimangrovi TaxID=2213046 RepID=UPI0011812755|nr:NlpC/P60 family protein [Robertkochia solimangrovi]TRZ41084.1 glycoside hydrolase [Robertkochia solimangrovi]